MEFFFKLSIQINMKKKTIKWHLIGFFVPHRLSNAFFLITYNKSSCILILGDGESRWYIQKPTWGRTKWGWKERNIYCTTPTGALWSDWGSKNAFWRWSPLELWKRAQTMLSINKHCDPGAEESHVIQSLSASAMMTLSDQCII